MYKYLFGPVPSRRLGMSLGVDLVPRKICSLDCVYCESGKTTNLSTERKEYILFEQIREELDKYFTSNPDPDYITFSGSGEPTLNSRISDVIKYIKLVKPSIPIALITNGTLLGNTDVQNDLKDVDLILPSLDAVSDIVFQKINRPSSDLKIESIIDGLVDFRKGFNGKIWLEIFLLPGYNFSQEELVLFRGALKKIMPDSIQLNTLDRPGTESDLNALTLSDLERAKELLGFDNIEIISSGSKKKKNLTYRKDLQEAILGTIKRRPCTEKDISEFLGITNIEVIKHLRILESEDKIESVIQNRGKFYMIKT